MTSAPTRFGSLAFYAFIAMISSTGSIANAAQPQSAASSAISPASASATAGQPNAATADSKPVLAGIVEGIVSYTRWPADLKQVRICVIGEGPGARDLLNAGALGSPLRAIEVQRAATAAEGSQNCQVLYFAARYTARQRSALNRFVARPFLTIGEGSEFCSDGGMFCIDSDEPGGRFGVNLDAVARSGLRINPQVLSLGRAKPKVAP